MSTLPTVNPAGLDGIDFVEFASPDPQRLHRLFLTFGFSRTMRHASRPIELYEQGDIRLLLNRDAAGHAPAFRALHGPSIPSMGWRVRDAKVAMKACVERGGTPGSGGLTDTAIVGIGGSLLQLVDGADDPRRWERLGFIPLDNPTLVPDKGFVAIDHLTNNVERGTMQRWASFYKDVFGFSEVRYFDIRGVKTGLTSYALRSPCGKFCIPINEADEAKSQINEYLEEYRGPGIQHLAFLTRDILTSLRAMDGGGIETLDIDADYYASVFDRVPNVTEDHGEIEARNVLVDGDERGYLLQIFTKNLVGPIFIEIIQRKNHDSFGEGNFGALFRSIERDQAKRGVFEST
ncbi:MAG: 4-hydroxyphenylpyruvate dioxygenase [Polyangiaceae bacterium]|jgi:4-hydroxyphenylpyruvate dioxygenase|nr:4-hydroxyphenylpyruvate dioxygenase [Polyangiaceae bacterium]